MDEKDGIDQDESLEKDESAVSSDKDAAASDNSEETPASDAEPSSEASDSIDEEGMTPEEKEMMKMSQEDAESDSGASDAGAEEPLSQDEIDKALEAAADMPADSEPVDDADKTGTDPSVKQADFQQLSSSSKAGTPKNIELLMDVDLPVTIELGSTKMKISDILNLAPGSIVELDKLVGEPVDLLVNQKCVARGEVVVVEESFGLRITQLVSPEERLSNLK